MNGTWKTGSYCGHDQGRVHRARAVRAEGRRPKTKAAIAAKKAAIIDGHVLRVPGPALRPGGKLRVPKGKRMTLARDPRGGLARQGRRRQPEGLMRASRPASDARLHADERRAARPPRRGGRGDARASPSASPASSRTTASTSRSRAGEVHALLGENGAGKSTLLEHPHRASTAPTRASSSCYGEPVEFHSPRDALDAGIGMVHQHFRLVEPFTVAENVVARRPPRRGRASCSDRRAIERRVAELGERYGLAVDPRARIWQLSVGEQQRVEILKALYREARVLILDEPTAVLTPQEAEALFETLRAMAAEGRTVIFISHKLHEVMAVADRVTVLRGGRVDRRRSTTAGATPRVARGADGRPRGRASRGAASASAPVGEVVLEARRRSRRRRPRRATRCATSRSSCAPARSRRRRRRGQRPARAGRGGHRHAAADAPGASTCRRRRCAAGDPRDAIARRRRARARGPARTRASRRASASRRTSCSSPTATATSRRAVPAPAAASASARSS